MSVLTQSYQCGTWFVCSILRELAVSNLGQPLFCLSITWSRSRNAYRDLWIMTIEWYYFQPWYSTVWRTFPVFMLKHEYRKCSSNYRISGMKLISTTLKMTWNFLKSLSRSTSKIYHLLTFKHWETHGCVVSTVATDALVIKHQADISTHNAD